MKSKLILMPFLSLIFIGCSTNRVLQKETKIDTKELQIELSTTLQQTLEKEIIKILEENTIVIEEEIVDNSTITTDKLTTKKDVVTKRNITVIKNKQTTAIKQDTTSTQIDSVKINKVDKQEIINEEYINKHKQFNTSLYLILFIFLIFCLYKILNIFLHYKTQTTNKNK